MKQKQPGGGLGSSHPFESNESVTAHWSMFQSVFNLSRLKHITKVMNFIYEMVVERSVYLSIIIF